MKVGDILSAAQVNRLPVGSVVVLDKPTGEHNTVTRVHDGLVWTGVTSIGASTNTHDAMRVVDDWRLVHLSGPVVPRVGEPVLTDADAATLPAGSVVVDTDDDVPFRAPAVKVGDNRWMWESEENGVSYGADSDVCGASDIVIYIPERADTGSSRSAA